MLWGGWCSLWRFGIGSFLFRLGYDGLGYWVGWMGGIASGSGVRHWEGYVVMGYDLIDR